MRIGKKIGAMAALLLALSLPARSALAEANEIRILTGTGGIGFLQLTVMEKLGLVEKHAAKLGLKDVKASYINLGGPTVSNDALLSGAADVVPAGPPG